MVSPTLPDDVDSIEELMNNHLLVSSEQQRTNYTSDVSSISTFESEEYKRLYEILSSPEQLGYFQTYLQSIHAHENLLFIEALAELRHEKNSKGVESIVHRLDNKIISRSNCKHMLYITFCGHIESLKHFLPRMHHSN